jgi:hypothetical protein
MCSAQHGCFMHFSFCVFRYFLNDFEIDPVAPVIIGTTFVFKFHAQYYYYYYYWLKHCARSRKVAVLIPDEGL